MQLAVKRSAAELMYTWCFPGAPVRIRLTIDVVRQIEQDIVDTCGVGAADREVWGLLLGQLDLHGTIEILGQKSLGFWPNDAASIAERRTRCARACAEFRAGEEGLCAIGYYRTACEHLIQLRDDDLALIEQSFVQPHNVFLVIDCPGDSGTSPNAGFFFWDAGRIHSAFSFMEFPFDAAQLCVRAAQQQSTMPRDAGMPEPQMDPPSDTLIEETPPPPAGKPAISAVLKYAGVALGLAILVVSAGMLFRRLTTPPGTRVNPAAPAVSRHENVANDGDRPSLRESQKEPHENRPLPREHAVTIKGALAPLPRHPRVVLSKSEVAGLSLRSREAPRQPSSATVSSQIKPPTAKPAVIEPPKYSPAQPLQRVNPIIPAALRQAISGVTSVLVSVRIDPNGRVLDVRPLSTDRSTTKFAEFATNAALNWTFEPARYDGRAVESEVVLEFRFVPDLQ